MFGTVGSTGAACGCAARGSVVSGMTGATCGVSAGGIGFHGVSGGGADLVANIGIAGMVPERTGDGERSTAWLITP